MSLFILLKKMKGTIRTIDDQISKISIAHEALLTMTRHAEEAFPNECCGFLYGNDNDDSGNNRNVLLALTTDNSKEGDQRRRFEISPSDYMKAERYAAEHDLLLVGVYHSHPNHPAIASEHDLAQAMPCFSYVIVSVMQGKTADVRSWKLHDEERIFLEERVINL